MFEKSCKIQNWHHCDRITGVFTSSNNLLRGNFQQYLPQPPRKNVKRLGRLKLILIKLYLKAR